MLNWLRNGKKIGFIVFLTQGMKNKNPASVAHLPLLMSQFIIVDITTQVNSVKA